MISGDAAQAILGRTGTFAIRPEKIRVLARAPRRPRPSEITVDGRVREVVYAGADDPGRRRRPTASALTALVLNSAAADRRRRGAAIRSTLCWDRAAATCSKPDRTSDRGIAQPTE